MFATWLEDPVVPDAQRGLVWVRDLDMLLVEAFSEFASDRTWAAERRRYETETGCPIPDLVDAYAGGMHRTLVTHSLARLMPLLAQEGAWLRERLVVTFNAQLAVIDHAWRRFVRLTYRKLMPRIKAERHRGNAGTFGTTKLMTWACAGRVMFTFERGDCTMTYVADDNDTYGLRSGPNHPGAPYDECVSMIEDVIAHWDMDKLQRSDTVGLG